MKTVLLAGGAGFIGSHTTIELIKQGYQVIIADNHSNSSPVVYERLKQITGQDMVHYNVDVCNEDALELIFSSNRIDIVIDFAGYKAVGESVREPYKYYRNNLNSTLALYRIMKKYGVNNFIFSSSATVYGMNNESPMVETMNPGPCANPYGWTKYMNEQILRDLVIADSEFSVVLLRYFNPIGAHASGLIGEDPADVPNNLMPYISQVAAGKLELLSVYGNDYDTFDGTGIRDYVHVVDLAKAHVLAARYACEHKGIEAFNIGTGQGYSVLQMVQTFEKVNGVKIPYRITERRVGDLATYYADSSKAEKVLGWKATKGLEEMCRDSWNWQKNNPSGYEG